MAAISTLYNDAEYTKPRIDYNTVYQDYLKISETPVTVDLSEITAPADKVAAEAEAVENFPDLGDILDASEALYKEAVDAVMYPVEKTVDIATNPIIELTDVALDGVNDITKTAVGGLSGSAGRILLVVGVAAAAVVGVLLITKSKSAPAAVDSAA